MPAPWLSILLPTYNGEAYLPEALRSVRDQAIGDIELIAVDDGSSDGTLAILQQAAQELPLRIIAGPRRKNWVASVNLALQLARGQYASVLHQDDGYLPGRLQTLREHIRRCPDAALYTHWAEFRDRGGKRVGLWRAPFGPSLQPIAADVLCERLLVQNFFAVASPMFRVADARKLGGMDESLWYTADWDFWLKLASLGETVCVPTPLAFFRLHSESQTIQRSRDAAAFREQLEIVLHRHLARGAIRPAARRTVRAAALAAIEINVALSSMVHRTPLDYLRITKALRQLNAPAAFRLLRDSRLGERILARGRAAGVPACFARHARSYSRL
jgi:GT2 family glycosyltransferase